MNYINKHSLPISIISAEQLRDKIDKNPDVTIINVLDEETYVDCHITGSINVPYDNIIEILASWDKEREIVLYCAQHSCPKSNQTYELLESMGFQHIYQYPGGIKEWLKKGFDCSGTCTQKYLHE